VDIGNFRLERRCRNGGMVHKGKERLRNIAGRVKGGSTGFVSGDLSMGHSFTVSAIYDYVT